MWQNLHTHTHFCDGKANPEEYVQQAIKDDVFSLGFSSHAPLPFASKWCMKKEDVQNYLQAITSVQQGSPLFQIYAGMEIDYIPNTIAPADFQHLLDYTIGSIHFVEHFEDGVRWEIDGPHHFFMEGFEKIFKSNIKETIARYFELTREMVNQSPPDIIGHLDKIKIQNIDNKLFNENDQWYKEQLFQTIDVIAEAGCIVEVNTRGIYQKKSLTTYPGPIALQYILEKKLPILISSDAHHPDDLINQFQETADLLSQLGFQEHAVLHHGDWIMTPFNKHGLEIRK